MKHLSLPSFFAALTLSLVINACGSKGTDPTPAVTGVQTVKVVVTATNAGSELAANPGTGTLGGKSYWSPESGSATSTELYNNKQVTYEQPASKIGKYINIKLAFNTLVGPIPQNSGCSLTAEIFADGVSKKKISLDALSTYGIGSTTHPSIDYTFTL